MSEQMDFYNKCCDSFQSISKKPENFLETNDERSDNIKQQLKQLYDFTKSEAIKSIKSAALPELIVENFDLEQIWQQIELQNDSVLTRSLANVSQVLAGKNKLIFKNLEQKLLKDSLEDAANVNSGDEEQEDVEENADMDLDEEDFINNDSKMSSEAETDEETPGPSKKAKRSEVEDEFFNLNEMEAFLNTEEKKLNDPDSGNDSEENSEAESEESVDLFGQGEAEEDDDDEDKAATAKYKDFFVQQDPVAVKNKRNKFLQEFGSDEEEEQEPRSNFELRQQRLQEKIGEIEEVAVGEKPWQLKGEITAENRPVNSLLEEVVDFDMTTRPPPVITEETSYQLEDLIKQRIKDRAFDSVERKTRSVDSIQEYKKKLVLNQEKSKESLAQIYENEFLQQASALNPESVEKEEEIPQLHTEINTMMNSLFGKLDALANYHFTPKPAVPELKIVSNLPAVIVEEVAPVEASAATLLAPEEIKNKPKGTEMGVKERTKTDKRRERRKKKLKQKIHAKKRDEQLEKTQGKSGKDKASMLEKVTKGKKNAQKMDETKGKSVKSSTAFFKNLEETVQNQIREKQGKVVKKKATVLHTNKFRM